MLEEWFLKLGGIISLSGDCRDLMGKWFLKEWFFVPLDLDPSVKLLGSKISLLANKMVWFGVFFFSLRRMISKEKVSDHSKISGLNQNIVSYKLTFPRILNNWYVWDD